MNVKKIAVVGAGIMGRGIAQVSAIAGFDTVLHDVSTELLDGAVARIRSALQKGVELGKVATASMTAAMERLSLETNFERATEQADVVIEAVPERIDLKLQIFARLDKACP